jgi:hypothetical protein
MPYFTVSKGARQGKMRLSLAVGRPGTYKVTRPSDRNRQIVGHEMVSF